MFVDLSNSEWFYLTDVARAPEDSGLLLKPGTALPRHATEAEGESLC
jgi:hypothetical protein